MRTNKYEPFRNSQSKAGLKMLARQTRVDHQVLAVLERKQQLITSQNIEVDADLAELDVFAFPNLLENGIEALVLNAIESMPDGGTLSITLIDNNGQWEIEVADSCSTTSDESDLELGAGAFDSECNDDELPVLLPFPSNAHLRIALDIAVHHGGQLQSWRCPQGGTAYVLAMPDRSRRYRAA